MNRVAIWDATSRCNLSCSHCYNQERYWKNAIKYPDLERKQIESIIDKLSELGFTRLHLLGGEPLLAKNLIDYIQLGKEHEMTVTMVTNGTLLSLEKIQELYEAGLSSITFSIDGTTARSNDSIRGEGSFRKAIENIKSCVEFRDRLKFEHKTDFRIVISFTLTRNNYCDSQNLIEFCAYLGVDGLTISYLSNEGKARFTYEIQSLTEEEKYTFIDRIIRDYKAFPNSPDISIDSRGCLAEYIYKKYGVDILYNENGCAGGDEQFYILADGTLLPCSPLGTSMGELVEGELLKKSCRPNLLKNTAQEVKNSLYLVDFYRYAHDYRTYEKIQPCNICKYHCFPCPLLYKGFKPIVKECLYAMDEISKIDQKMLQVAASKKSNLRIKEYPDYIEISNFPLEGCYKLSNTSHIIWNLIDGKTTVKEIIERLHSIFDEVEYKDIQKDVLEFMYDIRAYGFLEELDELYV